MKSHVATVCFLAHFAAVNAHPFQGGAMATDAAVCSEKTSWNFWAQLCMLSVDATRDPQPLAECGYLSAPHRFPEDSQDHSVNC